MAAAHQPPRVEDAPTLNGYEEEEDEDLSGAPPAHLSVQPLPSSSAVNAHEASRPLNASDTASSTTHETSATTQTSDTDSANVKTIAADPPRSSRWEHENVKRIEADIAANRYNTDAWLALLNEANRCSSDMTFLREAYERFLTVFPTAGRYWKQYAEHEMAAGSYVSVENIFRRCLLTCPNMELWRCYLSYIRLIKEGKPDERESVLRAFEFAIEHMGMDPNATHIWRDYITYAKGGPKAANQFEESQKVAVVRRLYQRAVESPINNLEMLWKEYDAFENSVDKLLAKGLLTEYAGKYMTARAMCHERRGFMDGLQFNMLPVPPTHSPQETHQVRLWRRLLQFEKSNPERASDERLRRRVGFTYEQALQGLYHFPEIWHEAAQYHIQNGAHEEGLAIYERAVGALPTNLFLHLALADLLEGSKRLAEAKEVYERIIRHTAGNNTLAYIHFLRFVRRTEGPDAARKTFVQAKKSPGTTYHLFVATALMEYHANRNVDYARDVFNAGLKKFIGEPAYVLHYLRFLIHLNEDNNVRAVFERVIGSAEMAPERAGELWLTLLEFEYAAGDLASIQKLERRRAQFFPELEPTSVSALVQRYRYLDLWPCEPSEAYLSLSFGGGGGSKGAAGPAAGGKGAPQSSVAVAARPDTARMLPFQPTEHHPSVADGTGLVPMGPFSPAPFSPGANPMAGPGSPITTAAAAGGGMLLGQEGAARVQAYLQLFPPPDAYCGPLVPLDNLLLLLRQAEIPAATQHTAERAFAAAPPLGDGGGGGGRKRKVEEQSQQQHSPSGGVTQQNAPPARDIFRQRQAAKLSRFK